MTENRWLIIPVEVKHREFLSRILLSAMAANAGYRVLLGKDRAVRRLAPALPTGIIFDKSLGTARHGKPQRFKKLGHKLAVLDEESTGYYGSPEQFLSVRLAEETLSACDRWYCISDKLRDHAINLYPKHKEKFHVSGLLRTDTWRPDFHDFYKEEKEKIEKRYGSFILFNSNFGGIIHARGDAFVKKQIRGQKAAYSNVEKRTEKIFEQGRPNLDAFIELLPKLKKWFPEHRLIIRPHPSETIAFWEEQFRNINGIEVISEGVVTPWILASSMLIHHGCTTGIEAEIMNRQHVMYAPYPDDHHDTEVMNTFAPIMKTEENLRKHIARNIDQPRKDSRAGQTKKESWFAALSGPFATTRIMDDLNDLAFVGGDLPQYLPLQVRLRMWMADIKPRSKREQKYSLQKWPGTNVEEIEEGLRVAAKGFKLKKNFSVKEVFPELFEITAY